MALTAEQRRILAKIKSIGRQVGASQKEIKAAIETGLVESNLRNLPGGDADSQGWRQERASLYRNPTNLNASIRRFFGETRAVRGKYGSAGALAAAVQRPAAQYRGRYQQMSARADQLLGGTIPGVSPQPASPSSISPPITEQGVTREGLLGQYLAQRGRPGALAALGESLGNLGGQPTRAAPSSAMRPAASPSSPSFGGYPVARQGKLIGTPYAGTHNLGNWQSDNAVDIGVPTGTPIFALEDGTIAKTVNRPSGGGRFAGGQITLRGRGNSYFYGHTSRIAVKPGQHVRRGQVIGYTGSANGVEHLHLGVQHGDPRRIIGRSK